MTRFVALLPLLALLLAGCDGVFTPSRSYFAFNNPSVRLPAGQAPYRFTLSAEVPDVLFTLASGPGVLDRTTGTFTPTVPGVSTITANDAFGNTASATVTTIGTFANGILRSVVQMGDWLYLGGTFTALNSFPAPFMIPLRASGTPDVLCDLQGGFNGAVRAVHRRGNSLYVGGEFFLYRGEQVNGIVKLDLATCAPDVTFNPPGQTTAFDNVVYGITSTETALYVGGMFDGYRAVVGAAHHIAKLDLVTGALDTTFSPPGANGFNGIGVTSLLIVDGSLYVTGAMTDYRGVADSANFLAKLDPTTGDLDTAFSPPGAGANGFDNFAFSLATSGRSLYVAGAFTEYRNMADSALGVAKLDLTTGDLDTTFSPPGAGMNGFDGPAIAQAISGGSLYVGGLFNRYRGVADSALYLAKLDLTTGAQDTTFSPPGVDANGADGPVFALATDGTSLYGGGIFSKYRGTTTHAGSLLKLDLATGVESTSFHAEGNTAPGLPNVQVTSLFWSGDLLYVGGMFQHYGGFRAGGIAKVHAKSFYVDPAFTGDGTGFNGAVSALLAENGSLYAAGSFSEYRGVPDSARGIAKLDPTDGTLDTTFSPPGTGLNGFDTTATTLVARNGALYVGGDFTAYRGVADSAFRIAKLNPSTGALDTTFSPPGAGLNGFDGAVATLAASATDLYAGGTMSAYRGVADSAFALAKLDLVSGAIDTGFSPVGSGANGFNGITYTLALAGGGLYAGGSFTEYRGVAQSANRIAKLDAVTGEIDSLFSPPGGSANGFDFVVQSLLVLGSSLYAGGLFNDYRGVAFSANNLAKLDLTTGDIDTTFSPVGETANGTSDQVSALGTIDGDLFLSGLFSQYRTGAAPGALKVDPTSGVARY